MSYLVQEERKKVTLATIHEKKAKGENTVACHPQTRPDYLEAEAVGRILRIAQAASCWARTAPSRPRWM